MDILEVYICLANTMFFSLVKLSIQLGKGQVQRPADFFLKNNFVLPPFQIIRRFSISRCIDFAMHLDIHYV